MSWLDKNGEITTTLFYSDNFLKCLKWGYNEQTWWNDEIIWNTQIFEILKFWVGKRILKWQLKELKIGQNNKIYWRLKKNAFFSLVEFIDKIIKWSYIGKFVLPLRNSGSISFISPDQKTLVENCWSNKTFLVFQLARSSDLMRFQRRWWRVKWEVFSIYRSWDNLILRDTMFEKIVRKKQVNKFNPFFIYRDLHYSS